MVDGNVNNDPLTDTTNWAIVDFITGTTGTVYNIPGHEWSGTQLRFMGADGVTWGAYTDLVGPAGPQGATGATGATGAQGIPGLAHDWDNAVTYGQGAFVLRNHIPYVSLVASNVGNDPETSPANWTQASMTSVDVSGAPAEGKFFLWCRPRS
jgi:hypothetical protein